jgi:hypothetical protein
LSFSLFSVLVMARAANASKAFSSVRRPVTK